MNSISAGAKLYAQASGSRFKRLGARSDLPHKVPDICLVTDAQLHSTIALTLSSGGGLLFSPTSDGGAISVILYDGDERYRTYVTTAEEFASVLDAIRDHVEAKSMARPTELTKRGPEPIVSK